MRYACWLFVAILLACGCVSKGGDVTGSTLIDVQSTTTLVTLSSTKTTTTTLALIKPRIASLTQGPCPQDYTSNRYENEAYVSRSGGTLTVTHLLDYVCCANITASVNATREGSLNVINLIEKNIGKVCRCICGYNITAKIDGITLDEEYLIQVWGVDYNGEKTRILAEKLVPLSVLSLEGDVCGKTLNDYCALGLFCNRSKVCARRPDGSFLGEMCGGETNPIKCKKGLECRMDGTYPGAWGMCAEPKSECDSCSENETCYDSRLCSMSPNGIMCGRQEGDLRCHRECASDSDCTPRQECREATMWSGDAGTQVKMCFPRNGTGCEGLTVDECKANPRCQLSTWMCDYVPPGKTFQEVCPRGGKGVECIPTRIMREGEMCGTIVGLTCEPGLKCVLENYYSDAEGTCMRLKLKEDG